MKSQLTRYAAVSALCAAILALRRMDLFLRPELAVEDGAIFYAAQLVRGGHALLEPYAGYFHLLPRLITAGAVLFPSQYAPLIFSSLAILLAAAAGAAFTLDAWRCLLPSDVLRSALPVAVYASLNSAALVGNLANLQWFLLPLAVLLAMIPAERMNAARPRTVWLLALVSLLATLSQPLTALLMPLALVRLVRCQGWARAMPAALLAGAGIQAGMMLRAAPAGRGAVTLAHATGVALVNRVVLDTLTGHAAAQSLSCGSREAALVAATLALVGIFWLRPRDRAMLAALAVLAAAPVALALDSRLDPAGFAGVCAATEWGAERYFVLGAVLVWYLVFRFLNLLPARLAPALALALALPAIVGNFWRGYETYDGHWAAHSREIDAWRKARDQCTPMPETIVPTFPGWVIQLPRLQGCDGAQPVEAMIAIPDQQAIRNSQTGEIFMIERSRRRYVPDAKTYRCLGLKERGVMPLTERDMDAIPLGLPLKPVECGQP